MKTAMIEFKGSTRKCFLRNQSILGQRSTEGRCNHLCTFRWFLADCTETGWGCTDCVLLQDRVWRAQRVPSLGGAVIHACWVRPWADNTRNPNSESRASPLYEVRDSSNQGHTPHSLFPIFFANCFQSSFAISEFPKCSSTQGTLCAQLKMTYHTKQAVSVSFYS